MGEQSKSDSFTRWWEFYVVRYLMGTVVGGIIVLTLSKTDVVFGKIMIELKDAPANLVLLAAYGLIYCYVASAPILVFHSSRFLLDPNYLCWGRVLRSTLIWILAASLFSMCGLALASFFGVDHKSRFALAIGLFSSLLLGQAVALFRTINRNADLFAFYKQLSFSRAASDGEITESYRHLREHGNSFFIVILEVVLGWLLFESGRIGGQELAKSVFIRVILLTAWIVPAAFVWLVSTLIESRFAEPEVASVQNVRIN